MKRRLRVDTAMGAARTRVCGGTLRAAAVMAALCLALPMALSSCADYRVMGMETVYETDMAAYATPAIVETPTPTPAPSPLSTPEPTPEPTSVPTPVPTPPPTPMPIIERWGMVDVRAYIPGIFVDMRYATDNNFMGVKVYTDDTCLLAKGTADKLKAAWEWASAEGYGLLIYDAYRPRSAQQALYDAAPDKSFVAKPGNGSRHNRGAAVDLTLTDAEGNALPMPSDFDDFTDHARRDYPGIDPEAKANAAYLTEIMTEAGFTTISNEWWHYDDSEYRLYPYADNDPAGFYDEAEDGR